MAVQMTAVFMSCIGAGTVGASSRGRSIPPHTSGGSISVLLNPGIPAPVRGLVLAALPSLGLLDAETVATGSGRRMRILRTRGVPSATFAPTMKRRTASLPLTWQQAITGTRPSAFASHLRSSARAEQSQILSVSALRSRALKGRLSSRTERARRRRASVLRVSFARPTGSACRVMVSVPQVRFAGRTERVKRILTAMAIPMNPAIKRRSPAETTAASRLHAAAHRSSAAKPESSGESTAIPARTATYQAAHAQPCLCVRARSATQWNTPRC